VQVDIAVLQSCNTTRYGKISKKQGFFIGLLERKVKERKGNDYRTCKASSSYPGHVGGCD